MRREVKKDNVELFLLTLLHSEWSKLHTILAFLSAIGLYAILAFLSAIGLKMWPFTSGCMDTSPIEITVF